MKQAVLIVLAVALFAGAFPALADAGDGATAGPEVYSDSFEPQVAEADEDLLPVPPADDGEIELSGEAGPDAFEGVDGMAERAVSAHDQPDALRSGFYYYEIEDGSAVITDVEEEPVYDENGEIVGWDKLQYVNVSIPATIDGCPVTRIGENVFSNARSLQSVTFPDCLREIGRNAFADCESLASAPLPAGLSLLDCNAFAGCVSLKSINIPLTLKTHEFVTEHAYPGPFSGSGLSEVRFADGITHIEPGLFQNCGALQSLDLPASVSQVGLGAFRDSGLHRIGLPAGLKEIHWGAFRGCEHLRDVTLPAGLTFLDCNAFDGCRALEKINIPKNVTCNEYVTEYAYSGPFVNCESLRSVTFADGMKTVPKGIFFRCNGLRKATLPKTVKKIDYGAFMECENLTEVVIPASVTRIENYAFEGCEKLNRVTLPAKLTYLGLGAFRNCKALKKINIPAKVTTHEDCAANSYYPGPFAGCSALRTVTFGKGIKAIPRGLFYQCDGIRKLTLPGTVVTIGEAAFCRCSNMTEIRIGKKVKTIGAAAFLYCDKLKHVYYGSSKTAWNAMKIDGDNDPLRTAKFHAGEEDPERHHRTSVDADSLKTLKGKYKDLKKLSNCGTFALPGLLNTHTDAFDCCAMTPQGICVTDRYILITAYCSIEKWKEDLGKAKGARNKQLLALEKDHATHNSVVYVVNRSSGELQKTLALPDNGHAGGIAYDRDHGCIWIAGSTKEKVYRVDMSALEAAGNGGKIKYSDTQSLPGIGSVSFLTYFENKLWIGRTENNAAASGDLKVYRVDNRGKVVKPAVYAARIPPKGNGIEVVRKDSGKLYLLVNQSPGRKSNSKMFIYRVIEKDDGISLEAMKKNNLTLPPMAEEICVAGNSDGDRVVYTIYESGASIYSTVQGNRANYVTDRIYMGKLNSIIP